MSATLACLLASLLAASLAGTAHAQPKPGKVFPYYDNCRRQQANQLRTVTYTGRTQNADGSASFCFKVNLLKQQCTPEVFYQKNVRIDSRCCNTTFAKIKFYANANCKNQLLPSPLTVPLAPQFNKQISPVWEYLPQNLQQYTSVKYTQFGPIPQDKVDGTIFCLRVAKPNGQPGSSCDISSLSGIANPVAKGKGLFQLAIYDRKTNNYECCPTFSIKV